jgi:hypothetical protein
MPRLPRLSSQRLGLKRLGPKLLSLTTMFTLVWASLPPSLSHPAYANSTDPLKGGVVITKEGQQSPLVNADELVQVEEGDLLDLTISTVVSAGISQEGDEFFGKLNRHFESDGKIVLPKGTIVHGLIDGMTDPKRMGRDGHIQLRFDYLITPDGREIPIEGDYTTQDSKGVALAKGVARTSGYTLVGGAVGALMVLKFGGAAAVAASNGYALLGGAAVGGALGLTAAMLGKGEHAMIDQGSQLQIKLREGMVLPTVNLPEVGLDDRLLAGLDVQITGLSIQPDPFGQEREMTLTLDVQNQSEYRFSMFDIALEDELGSRHYPSPFGETALWFNRLEPNSRMKGQLSFSVDDPTLQHYLVFFKQYTREPLARIAVDDALLKVTAHSDGKKKRRRRNS